MEKTLRKWEAYIPEEDRRIYDLTGYAKKQEFGKRPALLIIDVVLSFTGTKPMNIDEATKEYSSSCGMAAWDSLPKIKELLGKARSSGINVTYIKGNPINKYFVGDTTKGTFTREEIFKKYGVPIHPMVQPLETEYVCEKTRGSAFFGTPLATYLYRQKIDCLLISGCVTSGCIRCSTIDAWNQGFPAFVVEECVFDRSLHSHYTSLFELDRKYASVISLDEAKKFIS